MRTLFVSLALAVGVLGAGPALAQAPRCAVMPFEGSGDVVLRRSLARALEDSGFVTVVPEDDVDRAAEGGAGPAEVARATSAALVITGNASGPRRSRRLEVVAYAASGREVARETIRVRTGGAGRRALDEGVSSLLAAALPAIGSESRPTPVHHEATDADDAEDDEDDEGEDRPRGVASAASAGLGPSPAILAIRVGVVLRTRDAETLLLAGSPRSWRADPMYLELWAGLELRPLAQSQDLARGLYLRAEFANAVGLGSRDPMGREVPTHFFRVGGDAGYLAPIGEVVEVGGGVGFGWDAYNLGMNQTYPGLELPHVRPHLRGRLRLARELVVVGLESGLRIAVDRGALSAAFGGGDTIGFDVGASVSGTFDFGLTYLVDLSWAGFWHSYGGGGALGTGVSGVEQGFRVLVGGGYAFF